MAQDLTGRPPAAPAVRLEAGEEASGLAMILGDLLESNLRDFPGRRRVAASSRGDVVLSASDRDISVTLSFRGREVVISEGALDAAPALKGAWLEMAAVCSGRLNPLRAMAQGKLKVALRRSPALVAATGFVLSVPESFYEDDEETAARRRRQALVAGAGVAAVAAGVGVVVYVRRRKA